MLCVRYKIFIQFQRFMAPSCLYYSWKMCFASMSRIIYLPAITKIVLSFTSKGDRLEVHDADFQNVCRQ